jgi:hypothetical protein
MVSTILLAYLDGFSNLSSFPKQPKKVENHCIILNYLPGIVSLQENNADDVISDVSLPLQLQMKFSQSNKIERKITL